jgi:D-alanine-D-alanine ligase-like ATP-grasp enzyme
VFQSAKSKLKRRKGSYHVFGLDFMIDDRFQIHFIESNGYPGFTWSINYDTRGFVTDLMDLVLELHEAPAAFERLRAGDNYGGFQLIYSEIGT